MVSDRVVAEVQRGASDLRVIQKAVMIMVTIALVLDTALVLVLDLDQIE